MSTSQAPATEVMERLESHRLAIRNGESKVAPGEPINITEAWLVGDCNNRDNCDADGVRQGDLYFKLLDGPPPGFVLQENPSAQLVPGNSKGSKHCITNLENAEVWYPEGFSLTDMAALEGPFVLAKNGPVTIDHEEHGAINIPQGLGGWCYYQTEQDKEERRRVQD